MTALIPADRAALIPAVGKARAMKLPAVADEVLPNGLRVLSARRSGVPRVEVRLVIPTARGEAAPGAAIRLVARTLLSGTSERSATEIAEFVQGLGGNLEAYADDEDLVVTGSALARDLPALLELMAEVVVDATHPDDEVAIERARMVQEITLARSEPDTVAREALRRRVFGRHPYGRGLPSEREVERVAADSLGPIRKEWLLPKGSLLVVVGDVRPDAAIKSATAAFSGWKAKRGARAAGLPSPAPVKPGPAVLVERAGAVQTNIRMAGAAVPRHHPDHPALALANLVVGGYFISRMSDNIRENRGYTYGIGTGLQHLRATSLWTLTTDVGTEHTGPALVEIRYELERMLVGPIPSAELTSAKRYLAGTLAMAIQTQAGLTSYLSTLAAHGLPLSYLRDYPASVEALGEHDVIDAARRYLRPSQLVTVLVGELAAVQPAAEVLMGARKSR